MSTTTEETFRMDSLDDNRTAGEGMARFMERRGRRIVKAAGAYWHGVEGFFFMALPYHITIEGRREQVRDMLRVSSAVGARFQSHTTPGLTSGIYVRRDRDYQISSVDVRQRSRVRRGLERCEIRNVDAGVLFNEGLELNLDTMRRQGRFDPEFGTPGGWSRLVSAVEATREISAVGAFFEGRLASYMIVCREDGWLHILHQMSRIELLEHHPNHALTFEITSRAMRDPELDAVCYGTLSLVGNDGLHEYKQRLGYEFQPGHSAIELHPAIAPVLASGLANTAIGRLRARYPKNQRLERLASVLEGAHAGRIQAQQPPLVEKTPSLANRVSS